MYDCMIAAIHQGSASICLSFCHGLTEAFRRLELPAAMVPLGENGRQVLLQTYEHLFRDGHSPFLFDINGRTGSENVPKFSWVVDHPLYHPHLAKSGSHTVLGLIDEGHARLSGYSPAPTVFVPHGGPEPDERPTPWADRDIDVLFVGNVFPDNPGLKPLERLAYAIGAEAGRDGTDPFVALVAVLHSHGMPLDAFSRDDAARLLSIATLEAQRVERTCALLTMPAVRLHVVGTLCGNWENRLGPSVTVHGAVDSFETICDLIRRSRVVINLSAKFPHGSHERIWHAMACGAVVITNRSSFVERDFVHGQHIYYYQRPEEIGALVEVALAEGARTAEAARPIYAAAHTWEDRAARILSAMNRLTPQV